MKADKLNNSLQHIQVGRDNDVPIETSNSLWFLWIYSDGDWDAERITRARDIIPRLDDTVSLVFCCWHGQYRTNLFLMDKVKLIERLKCFTKG